MKLTITAILTVFVLTGCAISQPRVLRGNSSSVEVRAAHMAGAMRHLADPLADNWCRQYGKDAIFLRVEDNMNFYYICNRP